MLGHTQGMSTLKKVSSPVELYSSMSAPNREAVGQEIGDIHILHWSQPYLFCAPKLNATIILVADILLYKGLVTRFF